VLHGIGIPVSEIAVQVSAVHHASSCIAVMFAELNFRVGGVTLRQLVASGCSSRAALPVSFGLLVDRLAKLQLRMAQDSAAAGSSHQVFEETMRVSACARIKW